MKCEFAKLALVVLPVAFLASAPGALAQGNGHGPTVLPAAHHDVSPPWRDLVAAAPATPHLPPHAKKLRLTPPIPGTERTIAQDQDLQTTPLPLVSTTNGINFNGVSANGYAPPDTNGSAGDTQFLETTNVEFEVWDKATGTKLLGPALIDTLWNGFSGICSSGNGGDPVVVYDKTANRWVVSQLNDTYNGWCMAVSTSDDATGSYYRYEFDFGNNLPDYPKLGVWPDAYYWSANMFRNGSSFMGAQACAFDRASMLTGGAANAICFQESTSVASLLPSDLDGSTPPPAGEPDFYLELETTSSLGLFKFHVDFATPSNSTFTGPTSIAVNSFNEACGGGTCIPQEGTAQQLDSLGDRLMFRNAYRNFGSSEALVVDHSVAAGSGVGVRWYEIQNPNGTPTVAQQGTFAPDSTYRWMGSIAMDSAGDLAVGYSASSSSIYPAIRYAGRVPSDPAGSLESEASIIEGSGSQTNGLSRWGDYSSMSIDPSDDCTFWYTNEYLQANGSFNWNTRVAAFKFPSCGNTTPDFSLAASPSSQTVTQGQGTTYTATVTLLNGFRGTVDLTLPDCPTNATCTFNPTSLTFPGSTYTSTLTAQTLSSISPATYGLTVTGTSGADTHSASVNLVVNAPQPDFNLTASSSSVTVAQGSKATSTVTVNPLNGFTGSVSLSASGLPSGVSVSYSSNPTSSSSTLTFSAGSSATLGTVNVTITGNSGSLTHTATISLTVTPAPNFSLSASPNALTISRNGSGTSTISVNPQNGFSGSVSLSASGLPKGVSASFNPSSTATTSTLTLNVSNGAHKGTKTLTITGKSGGLTQKTTVTLTID